MAAGDKDLHRRLRAAWTLECVRIEPGDVVLDVGCGDGIALELAAQAASSGYVMGIDASKRKVRRARERNAVLIAQGRIEVHTGTAEAPRIRTSTFTKVYSICSIHLWPSALDGLRSLRTLLSGDIAITSPLGTKTTSKRCDARGRQLRRLLEDAGFVECRVHCLETQDVQAVCVVASTPAVPEPGAMRPRLACASLNADGG